MQTEPELQIAEQRIQSLADVEKILYAAVRRIEEGAPASVDIESLDSSGDIVATWNPFKGIL